MRRLTWAAFAVVLPLLWIPGVAGADGEEYSEDMVIRAAQAVEAIEAAGVDPSDVNSAPAVLNVMWEFGLPDEEPFPYYDPEFGDQLIFSTVPPPNQIPGPIPNCAALREAEDQARQVEITLLGLRLAYELVRAWAGSFPSTLDLVRAIQTGTELLGTLGATISSFRGQLAQRSAYGCDA